MPRPASPELLGRSALNWWRFRPGHLLAGALPEGREPTTAIGDRIRAVYRGRRWPEEPLWLCALRLGDGARAVFGRDPAPQPDVGTAVEASSAIPGFFTPVTISGERYVDGGTHSATNADLVAGLGLDVVVVISPMSARADVAFGPDTLTRLWWRRLLRQELAPARRAGTRVVVFEPGADDLAVMGMSMRAMEGDRMGDVTLRAERSARALLATEPPLGS